MGQLREGEREVGDCRGGVRVEEVQVEMEGLARSESLAIKVSGAEDEWAGMVGKTTGAGRTCSRFEEAGVRAGGAVLAGGGSWAIGQAGDAAEDGAECAAQNVGRFAFVEMNGFPGDKGKAQGREAKEQALFYDHLQWAH